MSSHAHDIDKEVKTYLLVFAALLVLTAVTVLISRFHFPSSIAIPLALIVALIKGSLVVGFFMHLISEKQLIYGILFFVVIFFFGLLLLPFCNDHDRLTGTQNIGKKLLATHAQAEHVH